MDISQEVYTKLRRYALRLDKDNGEDACQEVCVQLAKKPDAWSHSSPMAYLYLSVKGAVYNIWKKQKNELTRLQLYYNNDPIPGHRGLQAKNSRTIKRTRCRKDLHDLTEDNLVYMGSRRTCKICYITSRKDRYERKKV